MLNSTPWFRLLCWLGKAGILACLFALAVAFWTGPDEGWSGLSASKVQRHWLINQPESLKVFFVENIPIGNGAENSQPQVSKYDFGPSSGWQRGHEDKACVSSAGLTARSTVPLHVFKAVGWPISSSRPFVGQVRAGNGSPDLGYALRAILDRKLNSYVSASARLEKYLGKDW
ncbi:MAG: hypothetical protein ABSG46_06110 [Candidatus Binataceae bacterium]|jgi:hypothetical protein